MRRKAIGEGDERFATEWGMRAKLLAREMDGRRDRQWPKKRKRQTKRLQSLENKRG